MTAAEPIYLDYNATAPIREEVIALVVEIMATVGNASSVHQAGRKARARVDKARQQVADLIGAPAKNVIFTSGGTEADNLALRGFGPRHLIVSGIEHGAILAPALLLDRDAAIVDVDADGRVDLDALDAALAASTTPALVSLMLANNETGVIQPVAEAAQIAHAHNALLHCDAIQGAGKMTVDINELGADLLSLSAHKIGGPQGVGALVMREDRTVMAQMVGGGQEMGRRSGTENVAGIAGFGEAARLVAGELTEFAKLAKLRDAMEGRLAQIAPARRVIGADVDRVPNTSCVTMPGVRSDTQVMALDLTGIAVSAGSACSSGKVAASHVLDAMGMEMDEAMTAIRISLGRNTTSAEIERFLIAWAEIYRRNSAHTNAA
ncbi:MAG: cysteine desulfurase [Rhodospirillaceae bacterium]|jgi:cysteine desulfurase|nr:cysteine desulfurase [Rhodospirillaceae bacterium]MBT3493746.1 cysteine desulfurase [Rhodospirillaceae bacterium]MBT3779268.1 cysteine desulfurase [Rhodospirillaceae bacterium]MBT3977957.1 cysteine desulfurase [Rhodospirillaceae bacterium]MBT4167002.1 cysteine desulfurase [Rhodospirillaceae bacterium]